MLHHAIQIAMKPHALLASFLLLLPVAAQNALPSWKDTEPQQHGLKGKFFIGCHSSGNRNNSRYNIAGFSGNYSNIDPE